MRRTLATALAPILLLTVATSVLAASSGWLDPAYGTRGTTALRPLPDDRRLDAVGIVRSPRGTVVLMNALFAPGGGSDEHGFYLSGLTSNGSVDAAWNGGVPARATYVEDGRAWALLRRSTGPVVVGFANDFGIARIVVHAYRWDGTLDPTFSGDGGFFSRPMGQSGLGNGAAAQLPDGRLRICATVRDTIDDLTPGAWLLGVTAAGLPDTSVGPEGVRKLDLGAALTCNGIVADADGRLVVAGTGRVDGRRAAIVGRFAADGTLDPTFGEDGLTTIQWSFREFTAHALVRLGTSGFVVGGQAIDTNSVPIAYTARLDVNGDPAPTYGYSGVNRYAFPGGTVLRSMDVAGDGRLLLGIARRASDGSASETLQRISAATGFVDQSFGNGGIVVVPMRAVDSVVDGAGRSLTVGTRVGSVSTVLVQRRYG